MQNLSRSAAPAQSSEAPATLRYTHSLKPSTLALPAVSGSSTSRYLNGTCDGAVDAGERAQPVSSVTVDATWPCDANSDLKACALLSAGLTWSGKPAVQDAAVTDTSAVVPGTVLVKKVSNLTRVPAAEADSVDAFPGDVPRNCLTGILTLAHPDRARTTGNEKQMVEGDDDSLPPFRCRLSSSFSGVGDPRQDQTPRPLKFGCGSPPPLAPRLYEMYEKCKRA